MCMTLISIIHYTCMLAHTHTHTHTTVNSNMHDTDQYHTSYMRAHTHTHSHTDYDCSRNWVLILVGVKIMWEEEGFQFGFDATGIWLWSSGAEKVEKTWLVLHGLSPVIVNRQYMYCNSCHFVCCFLKPRFPKVNLWAVKICACTLTPVLIWAKGWGLEGHNCEQKDAVLQLFESNSWPWNVEVTSVC